MLDNNIPNINGGNLLQCSHHLDISQVALERRGVAKPRRYTDTHQNSVFHNHDGGHGYLPEHREERMDLLVSYISVYFTLLRQHMYSFPESTRRPEGERSGGEIPVSVQKEQAARALLGVSVSEEDRGHITERYIAACASAQNSNIPVSDRAAILNKYMDAYTTLKKSFERQGPHKLEILRTSRKRRILDILKMMFTFEDDSFLHPKKYTPAQERLIDTLKVDLDGVSDGKDD